MCLFIQELWLLVSVVTLRGHRSAFSNYDVFLSLRIVFTLIIIVDPDEMLHNACTHLGVSSIH